MLTEHRRPDGVLDVRLRVGEPLDTDLTGLHIWVFPAPEGEFTQLMALYPERGGATHAAGETTAVTLTPRSSRS